MRNKDNLLYKGLFICISIFSLTSFISKKVANLFLGISVVLFLIIKYKDKESNLFSINMEYIKYFKALSAFAISMLISALCSGHMVEGLELWGHHFVWRVMPFVIVITIFDDVVAVSRILNVVFVGFLIDALYAIYQGIFVYGIDFAHGRAAGFIGHPMVLAGLLCVVLPILLLLVVEEYLSNKHYWFYVSLFFIGCMALLFNSTRGAWLSLAIVFPILSMPYIFKNKKIMIGFVSTVFIICIVAGNSSSLSTRISSISNVESNWSNRSRFEIWKTSWEMFKDNPVLGVGLGQFIPRYRSNFIITEEMQNNVDKYKLYVENKNKKKLTEEQKNISREELKRLKSISRRYFEIRHLKGLSHAHNNIMQMLSENGIVGLIGYMCAFGYILCSSIKNFFLNFNPYSWMVVGTTSALILQGLTEYNFGNAPVMKVYWLVLACLIVLSKAYNKENFVK